MSDPDCIFCKIVAGEIPADIIAESDGAIAFRDLSPEAPTHALVIPRDHYANLAEVAAALRKIHGCGATIGARFDAFRLVENYAAATRERGGEVPPAYEIARAAAQRIEAVPIFTAGAPVLCHNDLLPANFIDTPAGMRLVDWEYAGMGNRWFDLGNFAVNNELGAAEEEEFLVDYLGTGYLGTADLGAPPTPADLAALRLMRLMSDFREAMWGVVQQAISDLDFDFRSYADKHFDRLLAAIEAPEFEAQLEDANASR